MPEKPKRKTAMISSTSVDLPEHRQQAMEACLRQGIFPRAMEHLPARDADAIRVSLEMVDEADIYIGIYAWRYGHVPEGHDISITEMEFNRAVKRGIPVLVFTIHRDHPLTITMIETDKETQEKLTKLKKTAMDGVGPTGFGALSRTLAPERRPMSRPPRLVVLPWRTPASLQRRWAACASSHRGNDHHDDMAHRPGAPNSVFALGHIGLALPRKYAIDVQMALVQFDGNGFAL
jgi:hypothetical protein